MLAALERICNPMIWGNFENAMDFDRTSTLNLKHNYQGLPEKLMADKSGRKPGRGLFDSQCPDVPIKMFDLCC
jgi:hypothetical protein